MIKKIIYYGRDRCFFFAAEGCVGDPSFQGIERMTRGALYSEVRNGDDDV